MSGYELVRSASLTRVSPNVNRKPCEVKNEQQVRLVGEEAIYLAGIPVQTGAQPTFFCRGILLAALLTLLAVAVLFGLTVLARTLSGDKTQASVPTHTDFRRPASDYVLDLSWDYSAPPQVREYDWVIQDIVANPDGVFRPMITINGRFPGEMIRCNEGDTIVINVDNQSVNATAIHWHGLFQNGTNWMDGTPGVTQCPIAPGLKFRYQFTVSGQWGTYFYHGHQGAQGHDGLAGPIIIHSRDERATQPIAYASDRVVMLQDWYYSLSSELLLEKLSPGSETSPIPNGALINGANVVNCALHPLRACDSSLASLATLDLQRNQNHRLRILNVGAFAWFEVSVDGHSDLPTTEVDGTTVEPSYDDSILVAPGQRYSIILAANQTDDDAFWFRARMVKNCFAKDLLPEHGFAEARAVVRYYSPPGGTALPTALPATKNNNSEYAIVCKDPAVGKYKPILALRAPEHAHHSWHLHVNLEIGDWRLERGFLNESSFRPRLQSPTLHRVVDGLAVGNASFQVEGVNSHAFDTRHELVVSSKEVEVLDVVLQNFDKGNHPFHLHGHQFFVLGSGNSQFPGYESLGFATGGRGLLDPRNSTVVDNPLRRDVATVQGFGWLLIRFVADNPGLWLFHCHMIWHGESGMALQFLARLDLLQNWTIPESNLELCQASIEELEKGAAPKESLFYGHP